MNVIVNVIEAIHGYVDKTRLKVANYGHMENTPLSLQEVCKKMLPGAKFMKKRLEKLKDALNIVDNYVDRVRELRSYPSKDP